MKTMTLKEAAKVLGVHYQTAKYYVKTGKLKNRGGGDGEKGKRGTTYIISEEDVQECLTWLGTRKKRGPQTGAQVRPQAPVKQSFSATPAWSTENFAILDKKGVFKKFLEDNRVSWARLSDHLSIHIGDLRCMVQGNAHITSRTVYLTCKFVNDGRRTGDMVKAQDLIEQLKEANDPEPVSKTKVPAADIGIKPTLEVTYYYTVIKCKEAEDLTMQKVGNFVTAPYIFTSRTAALEWIKKDAMEKHKCLDLDPHEIDKDAFYAYYVNKPMFRAERAVYYVRRVDNGIYVSSAESRT